MSTLGWIVLGGVIIALVPLVGGFGLLVSSAVLGRLLLPLVAFSAGALLGGALFHLIPEGLVAYGAGIGLFAWVAAGFAVFFALEQFLHWHHCHRADAECRETYTWMILIGDSVHKLLSGLAVGGAFLVSPGVGLATLAADVAHEVPRELGDFGVLVHGGFPPRRALALNVLTATPFLLGGLVAYFVARELRVEFLLPFAAGNFLYVAASDLVPQVNRHETVRSNVIHFLAFLIGAGLLLWLRVLLGH